MPAAFPETAQPPVTMKLRKLTLLSLSCVALAASALSVPSTPSAQPPVQERKVTPLGSKMREINGILRSIGKGIGDESKAAANLEAILRLQTLAVESKKETPTLIGRMEGDERAEMTVGYRMQMNQLLAGLIELENAVLKGEGKAAEKAMRKLNEAKAEGHGEYKGR